MCDNNNSNNKLISKSNLIQNCQPCSNDKIACQTSSIREVMANNLAILNCFKNIKCQLLAYINSVSTEFVQNIEATANAEPMERDRFNVLLESLIAGIHGSVRAYTNGQIEPYFQLYVQTVDPNDTDEDLYSIGSGSTEGGDLVQATNMATLYPNKLSLFSNCNKGDGTKGDEILYYFIPSIQILYDPKLSYLALKWGDASYSNSIGLTKKCLFPLIVNNNSAKMSVFNLVPKSENTVWANQTQIFTHVRDDVLVGNDDLLNLISNIDTTIRKCELTQNSLKLKLRMAASDIIISEIAN